ncbi:MAG: flagellinolysin [Gammaproteobacteria bacterium]|nr:flagellinolysin [Gammaproteobacteria bacterium]
MEIASGLNSLMLSRILNKNSSSLSTTVARLSSGTRINSARDDAAGLAISTRFTSQLRGMRVGQRNLNDAVSMLQVAEGGLSEVTRMLQRMRDLSVQAANTGAVSVNDRKLLQTEVSELTNEIQRTLNSTEFNGVHLLTPLVKGRISTTSSATTESNANLKYALQSSWMSQAESAINTWYGLSADNVDLNVVFDDTGSIGSEGAALSANNYNAGTGLYDDLTLTIDLAEFSGASLPNGGSGPMHYDRIIAREMTKAVLARTINTNIASNGAPDWFVDGAAELLIGGDERVAANGGVATVMAEDLTVYTGSSAQKAKAYLALRFMVDELAAAGPPKAMSDFMGQLASQVTGLPGNNFWKDFSSEARGNGSLNNQTKFMAALDSHDFSAYDIANADTGAIGGTDASSGARDTTAAGTINDVETYEVNPTNLNVIFPGDTGGSGSTITTGTVRSLGKLHYDFQVGANQGQNIRVQLEQLSVDTLEIDGVNLVKRAQEALVLIDNAIDKVVNARARFGAQNNRIEHTLASLETRYESYAKSRSAIADADYATEIVQLTKAQLLNHSASSMMAQANGSEALVMDLLNSTTIIQGPSG